MNGEGDELGTWIEPPHRLTILKGGDGHIHSIHSPDYMIILDKHVPVSTAFASTETSQSIRDQLPV